MTVDHTGVREIKMAFPKFEGCKDAINNNDLDEAEACLGVILPHDLRQHFLKYNGGWPASSCFPFHGEHFEVKQFYSIKHGLLTLERMYDPSGAETPAGLIPFACDSAGNEYCYSVVNPTMHSICIVDHEDYQDPDQGVTILAPSLQAFLEAFVPDPDYYDDEDEDDDEE